jgi:hypothetical protein
MNIREDFRNSPHFKAFANMADTEAFKVAVQSALNHYSSSLPEIVDPTTASANFNRFIGARKFAELLLRFHLNLEVHKPTATENLNHNLK